MIRLAHLSDVHISASSYEWAWHDYFDKRLTSWFNYRVLGRRYRFRGNEDVLQRLMSHLERQQLDALLFSGDATALGFASEFRRATELLRVAESLPYRGIAVPGNHDYLNQRTVAQAQFERAFAPWLQGERCGDDTYPFAVQVGHVWVIGVNSCTANFWPWDASGAVGRDQCARLAALLARLPAGPRLLLTHYPVCLANGKLEAAVHGLRDLADVVKVAAAGGVGLWLHGHRHTAYAVQQSAHAPFPIICAGSATQHGKWTHMEYVIDGAQLTATQRVYEPSTRDFRDAQRFTLTLATQS